MQEKERIAESIDEALQHYGAEMSKESIREMLEVPPNQKMGDYAFPCYALSKVLRKSPVEIAAELGNLVGLEGIERCEPSGAYLNFYLNRRMVGMKTVKSILDKQENAGQSSFGNSGRIAIDYSSPNIAKPFSMGHLRSTVIGNAIANISEKCGYQPVRINHLGDWGTQFGKLITAYGKWGEEKAVKENPIGELLSLYIRFHDEAEKDGTLEAEAREWFKRLENRDEKALKLWKWFKEVSLVEFENIYQLLGIQFDSWDGEAFYNDKMEEVVGMLEDKGVLTESEGADVVSLEEYGMPPCLIKKSDGATLYATRDLAAAFYRKETYRFEKAIYVVGGEQSLHFRQIFRVIEKLGCTWSKDMNHVSFGMILKDGKKMSTRKGKIVLLGDVLKEAIEMAGKNIEARNPDLAHKEKVAMDVGVGAVLFHDLKHHRFHDIEFSLESMLTFEGETGPYIQYTHARARSILRKAQTLGVPIEGTAFGHEMAWAVIVLLKEFDEVIQRSFEQYDPSEIARYLIHLAQSFNKYYSQVRILGATEDDPSKIALVEATAIILKEGLRLLGISAPEEM